MGFLHTFLRFDSRPINRETLVRSDTYRLAPANKAAPRSLFIFPGNAFPPISFGLHLAASGPRLRMLRHSTLLSSADSSISLSSWYDPDPTDTVDTLCLPPYSTYSTHTRTKCSTVGRLHSTYIVVLDSHNSPHHTTSTRSSVRLSCRQPSSIHPSIDVACREREREGERDRENINILRRMPNGGRNDLEHAGQEFVLFSSSHPLNPADPRACMQC